jgi:hypothetical protein
MRESKPNKERDLSMEPIVLLLAIFAAGYAAAIYTWPQFRAWINGAEAEAAKLKAQAEALLTRAKPFAGK